MKIIYNRPKMDWHELDAKGIHIVNCWGNNLKGNYSFVLFSFNFRTKSSAMKSMSWWFSIFNFNIYYSNGIN